MMKKKSSDQILALVPIPGQQNTRYQLEYSDGERSATGTQRCGQRGRSQAPLSSTEGYGTVSERVVSSWASCF
jgi:hypothetical protein